MGRYHSGQFLQLVIYIFLSLVITLSLVFFFFCVNRCITDAVIKTSRCPQAVCMTPTLLYSSCLFRLDLTA